MLMRSASVRGAFRALFALGCALGVACSAGELSVLKRGEPSTPQPAARVSATQPSPPGTAAPRAFYRLDRAQLGSTLDPPAGEELLPALSEQEAATTSPEYVKPSLISIARETFIYARPSFKAQKLGYLRVGAIVGRAEKPSGNEGCKRGWFRIQPEGYACVDNTASLDTDDKTPFAELARLRPDRMAALPYRYGRSRYPTPPLYTRLPNRLDQERSEIEIVGHLRARTSDAWQSVPSNVVPDSLRDGRSVPTPWGYFRQGNPLTTGRAMPDSGFALLGIYEHEGRRFALGTDFELLPLDRLKPVEPSRFHGLRLNEQVTLPVAFVRSRSAYLYSGEPKKTGLSIARKLDYREAVPLTGKEVIVSGARFLETQTHDYIKDENLVRVDRFRNKPGWATPGRSWLHVSVLQQSLVMYEGERPTYVTLVSTGVDGLGDPLETRSTIRGQFLVHTKHVSVTMDSDEQNDEFDLRDVPYVQYFTEGYALHAAYWHDAFGQPYSHGCVNLSPLDARALFHMTDPPVPQAWHGAMSLRKGTLVHVTP